MAAVTLADIESAVRFRGDFRNAQRFPSANVQKEIQAAFDELYEFIADTNEGYWDTSSLVTTSQAVDFVALSVGTWRVHGIDRLDGSEFAPLVQVGFKDRNRYGSRLGRPRGFRLTARGADLYPSPDAIYTLRVTYTPVAPTLDGIGREYYNGWEEYVIFGALVRITLNQRRDASEWQQQLDIQRGRIVRGASQRKAAEPEYLNLYEADCDPDERWH